MSEATPCFGCFSERVSYSCHLTNMTTVFEISSSSYILWNSSLIVDNSNERDLCVVLFGFQVINFEDVTVK